MMGSFASFTVTVKEHPGPISSVSKVTVVTPRSYVPEASGVLLKSFVLHYDHPILDKIHMRITFMILVNFWGKLRKFEFFEIY